MALLAPNRFRGKLIVVEGIDGSGAQARLVAGSLLVAFLTYPAGIVGTLFSMALVYPGIATPAEALCVAAPLYAVAGMFQWYVALPLAFGRPTCGHRQ